jgi:RNA polymerase sigma-70 factor (ECF subfamily)
MDDLETIYRRHAPAVLRFAWGLCGNRTRAEDLVSETFVRLLTKAPKIETQTALAYLLAIARNAFLDGTRSRRREVPLSDDLRVLGRDPADRIDDAARLRAVMEKLRALPEGERAALLLRVDHELPYDEIAGVLGISITAAKVRVHRARSRLAAAREVGGKTR